MSKNWWKFWLDVESSTNGYFSNDWNHAITSAILSDTSILETNPSCPTGNCTFPVFSSLAFCSNCIDITQYLQQNSKCSQIEVPNPRETIPQMQKFGVDYTINCTYWLPLASSGQNYTYDESLDYLNSSIHKDSSINFSWTFTDDGGDIPYSFNDAPSFWTKFLKIGDSSLPGEIHLPGGEVIPSSFAAIALIKAAPRTGSTSTGFLDTANICALSVCAREYNISMTSGLLQSEVVSTSYSELTRYDDPSRVYIGNFSYTFEFSDEINDFDFVANKTAIAFDGRHVVASTFEEKMYDVLRKVLEGSILLNSDRLSSDVGFTSTTNIIQNGLNASTNIPKTMDRVAAAMSNRLRDISNLTVQGQSESMELYVRVSWLWLLLPALCVVFGTILLLSVMIVTRKHKLPIWKTSELALLFHGLDFLPLSGDTIETMQKASEMEDVALALQVRLGRGSKGVLKLERKMKWNVCFYRSLIMKVKMLCSKVTRNGKT